MALGDPHSGGAPQALELSPEAPARTWSDDGILVGLGVLGPIPRPEMPPYPDRAPLSCRPLPRAGPQAPDPRARVAAAARTGGPLAAAVLRPRCGPSNSRRCGAKAHTKGRGALPATPPPIANPLEPHRGDPQSLRAPQSSGRPRESPPRKKFRDTSRGLAEAAKSPSGRCPQPHNNFETLGLGAGAGRGSPKKKERGIAEGEEAVSLFLQHALSGRPQRSSVQARGPGASARPGAAPGFPEPFPRRPPVRGRAPGLCPAGPGPRAALTSAGLRSPRACAEPDKWYAMTRGMITLLLLVIIRVNAI